MTLLNPPDEVSSNWWPTAMLGCGLIFGLFGVIGGWAAVSHIDQAATASGLVNPETNRKAVQHFEGGIVDQIHVAEGDVVKEGQILVTLRGIQAQANADLLAKQKDYAFAMEARFLAEREEQDILVWPKEFSERTDPDFVRLLSDQMQQFKEKRGTLETQTGIMSARIDQLNTKIDGLAKEQTSIQQQIGYIDKELEGLNDLASKNLVVASRVFAMQREQSRLQGESGRLIAEKASTESQVSETRIQIQQLHQKYKEDAAGQLSDTRQKIAELDERKDVASDILDRTSIRAPRPGTVQNLRVFSQGQVIRPGETLMEIIPQDEPLIVNAQFSPNDIDGVHAGQDAEIRFPAFHGRTIPVMLGNLKSVSHDRLIDEQTRQPYYLGVVALDRAKIPEELRARLRSGMQAEVIVAMGSRTVLNFLISPLIGSLNKTFREQ